MPCRSQSDLQAFRGFSCAVLIALLGALLNHRCSGVMHAPESIARPGERHLFRFDWSWFPTATTAPGLFGPMFNLFAFWGRVSYPYDPLRVLAVKLLGDFFVPGNLTAPTVAVVAIDPIGWDGSGDLTERRIHLRSYSSSFLPQSDLTHGPIPTDRETASPGSSFEANSPGETHS